MRFEAQTPCSLASLFPFPEAGAELALAQLRGCFSQDPRNTLSSWNWQPPETGSSGQGRAGKGSPTCQQLMLGAGLSLGCLPIMSLLFHVSEGGKEQSSPVTRSRTLVQLGKTAAREMPSMDRSLDGHMPGATTVLSMQPTYTASDVTLAPPEHNASLLKTHVSFSECGLCAGA